MSEKCCMGTAITGSSGAGQPRQLVISFLIVECSPSKRWPAACDTGLSEGPMVKTAAEFVYSRGKDDRFHPFIRYGPSPWGSAARRWMPGRHEPPRQLVQGCTC